MNAHTPTPWPEARHSVEADNEDHITFEGGVIGTIGRFDNLEDAKLAQRAVNAHDDLVKALQEIKASADFCLTETCGGGTTWLRGHKDISAIAAAALAKAKGGAS